VFLAKGESLLNKNMVVLVTGASSGLGRAAAELLASCGYTVYGTSRDPDSSSPDSFIMLRLDVANDDSVAECVAEVINTEGRIDALICNAGYALSGAVEETSVGEAKAQMETNFFGVVRMVSALLPHMRYQQSGRIIIISSVAGMIGLPYHAYYSASKYALEGYAEALSREVYDKGIKVSLIEPGFFHTKISDSSKLANMEIPQYTKSKTLAVEIFRRSVKSGRDPEVLATLLKKVVEAKKPKLRYIYAGWTRWFVIFRLLIPEKLFEAVLRRYAGI
jgi:NAD(P)-dependent dehydrogenase (short-subunit alcohol dehydrogenase family)